MGSARKLLSRMLIGMVLFYRTALHGFMGYGGCRFTPTCSEYMIQAIRLRGPFVGMALGLWRILRCNPFSRGGYDPVPPPGRWRSPDRALYPPRAPKH